MTASVEYELGDVVEIVTADLEPLPVGLASGFQVRLIRVESGHRVVERDGREWRLRPDQIRPRLRASCAPRRSHASLAVYSAGVIPIQPDDSNLRRS